MILKPQYQYSSLDAKLDPNDPNTAVFTVYLRTPMIPNWQPFQAKIDLQCPYIALLSPQHAQLLGLSYNQWHPQSLDTSFGASKAYESDANQLNFQIPVFDEKSNKVLKFECAWRKVIVLEDLQSKPFDDHQMIIFGILFCERFFFNPQLVSQDGKKSVFQLQVHSAIPLNHEWKDPQQDQQTEYLKQPEAQNQSNFEQNRNEDESWSEGEDSLFGGAECDEIGSNEEEEFKNIDVGQDKGKELGQTLFKKPSRSGSRIRNEENDKFDNMLFQGSKVVSSNTIKEFNQYLDKEDNIFVEETVTPQKKPRRKSIEILAGLDIIGLRNSNPSETNLDQRDPMSESFYDGLTLRKRKK
jgi:hypothetical protein